MKYEVRRKTDGSGRTVFEGRNFRVTVGRGVLRAVARVGGYTVTVAPTSKTKKVLTEEFGRILDALEPTVEVLRRQKHDVENP